MFVQRTAAERIDQYSGPYERWVFSEELGRPFSFPLIASAQSDFYTALLEGGDVPDDDPDFITRVPPLWGSDDKRKITPFAFQRLGTPETEPAQEPDKTLATTLGTVRDKSTPKPDGFTPRFRVNFPIIPETWVPVYNAGTVPATWKTPGTPPKAIIGVIDDGLPFAHSAFLDADGNTRVSHCWLQSAMAEDEASVPFGREYTNDDIDGFRDTHGNNEMQLYLAAGAISQESSELDDHLRRHSTHGAHVLGVAGGNHSLFPDHPVGDDVQIIAVQLPNTIAWDTSGFGKEMYMLSAIHYIFERASRIAQACGVVGELPLVLNFSYGWIGGRHDGKSEMELAIQDLVCERQTAQPSTAFVMPTGNNFNSRMHARWNEADFANGSASIYWHVQPDDRTSSYFELWFPEPFDPTGYSLTVTPPHGQVLDAGGSIDIAADPDLNGHDEGDPRRFVELEMGGANIGQLSADKHRGERWRVLIALIPTVYTRHQGRKAPAGAWTVTLSRTTDAAHLADDQDVLFWLQRDDDPSDLKSHGRQSYLEPTDRTVPLPRPRPPVQQIDPDLPSISGFGSLNGVASSALTTRVGGYVQHTGRPTDYSGAGGLRIDGNRGDPTRWGQHADVIAVADQSNMMPGFPSIGVLSGARTRLVGTSGAAPAAARLMVRNVAAGLEMFDGFEARPPLPSTEDPVPSVQTQFEARTAPSTAPPVARGGPQRPT